MNMRYTHNSKGDEEITMPKHLIFNKMYSPWETINYK